MSTRRLARFLQDDKGNALAEFALLALVSMVLLGGTVDFFRMYWEWNAAMKAVERGARIAAVSDPGVPALRTMNAIGTANLPGDTVQSTPSYDPNFSVTCTGAACGATMNDMLYGRGNAACGAASGAYNVGMCHLYPRIRPENVRLTYTASHLGYYGRPGGPVVTVTVELLNMSYEFVFLRGFFPFLADGTRFFPRAVTSITSEDLSSFAP